MKNGGGVPLRGWFFRTDRRGSAGAWIRSITCFCLFLTLLFGLSGLYPLAFAQNEPSPPDFHCLHVPYEQRHACIGGDLAGWRAYQWALKSYREQQKRASRLSKLRAAGNISPESASSQVIPSRRLAKEQRLAPENHDRDQITPASVVMVYRDPLRGELTEDQVMFWEGPNRWGEGNPRGSAPEKVRVLAQTEDGTWLKVKNLDLERAYDRPFVGWVQANQVQVLGKEADVLREEKEQAERLKAQEAATQQKPIAWWERQQQAREQLRVLEAAHAAEQAVQQEKDAKAVEESFFAYQALFRRFAAYYLGLGAFLLLLPVYWSATEPCFVNFLEWPFRKGLLISTVATAMLVRIVFFVDVASWLNLVSLFLLGVISIPALWFLPMVAIFFVRSLAYLFTRHPAEADMFSIFGTAHPTPADIARVKQKMYNPRRDGLLGAWSLWLREKRLNALLRMISKEQELVDRINKTKR